MLLHTATEYPAPRLERVLVALEARAARYYRRVFQPLLEELNSTGMEFDCALPGHIEDHETISDVEARVASGKEQLYYNRIAPYIRNGVIGYTIGGHPKNKPLLNLEFGARWFRGDFMYRKYVGACGIMGGLLEGALRKLLQSTTAHVQLFTVNERNYIFLNSGGCWEWHGRSAGRWEWYGRVVVVKTVAV